MYECLIYGPGASSESILTYSEGVKQPEDGALVLDDARLLNVPHKLLQVHVLFGQLEALDGPLVAVEGALLLRVPLDAADEALQLRPALRLAPLRRRERVDQRRDQRGREDVRVRPVENGRASWRDRV